MKASPAHFSKRRWLCVAYAFPPINRSGTHRTTAFVKGLDALGWQATVLTTQPAPDEKLDRGLLLEIPEGTEVIRARWWRPLQALIRRLGGTRPLLARTGGVRSLGSRPSQEKKRQSTIRSLAELFATPDSRTGWILPAVWEGLVAIRRRRPEIIYSTSPYASAHLIALALSRLTRIPWVADFRDPWCGNPFQAPRGAIANRLDVLLESCVVREAGSIVCNTPTLAEHFASRYPALEGKVRTILNGADAESFAKIAPHRLLSPEYFVFAHCGQFYGPRDPAVLFNAFRRFFTTFPDESQNVRLMLIGPDRFQGRPLADIASEAGIANCVIICGEKTHSEALALAAGADALVLVGAAGSGGNLQIPQKLFEYLALRRPIIALLESQNPGAGVLKEAQAPFVLCDPGDADDVAMGLREGMDLSRKCTVADFSGVHCFDRSLRIAQLHALFATVTGGGFPNFQEAQSTKSYHTISRALDEVGVPSMMPA